MSSMSSPNSPPSVHLYQIARAITTTSLLRIAKTHPKGPALSELTIRPLPVTAAHLRHRTSAPSGQATPVSLSPCGFVF
jgi:hypothetical protein